MYLSHKGRLIIFYIAGQVAVLTLYNLMTTEVADSTHLDVLDMFIVV